MPHDVRPARMTRRLSLVLLAGLAPALVLAACGSSSGGLVPTGSSAAAPSASPSIASPVGSPATPVVSDAPGAVGGNPGGVTPMPIPSGPGGPGAPSIEAQPPQTVVPVAGLQNVHDVRAESVSLANGTNGHWMATVTWWSGPAPCSQLAEIRVSGAQSITLTVREGSGDPTIACPALATHKQATVDLGPKTGLGFSVGAYGTTQIVTVTGGPS